MTGRLDELLRALPLPQIDHPLDQLEPLVWRRIEAQRGAMAVGTLRFQLVAAGMALCIGLAIGWSVTSSQHSEERAHAQFASYEQVGPLARLESGL